MDGLRDWWRSLSSARARQIVLLVALLGLALGTVGLHVGELTETAELGSIDARFRIRGPQMAPDRLLVVAIDDVSLTGMDAVWPLPLDVHTAAVEQLAVAGAEVLAYTVTVSSDVDRAAVARWSDALRSVPGGVVLGTKQRRADDTPVVLGGSDALERGGAVAADARLEADDDGTVRRFDATSRGLPTLPVAVVSARMGGRLPDGLIGGEGASIDYAGPARTLETVSFASVLAGQVPPALVAGRIVVVGASSSAVQDLHKTPLEERMSAAEIQANAIATLLADAPLRALPVPGQAVLILLVCMVPIAAIRLDNTPVILIVLGVLLGYLVTAQLAFNAGTILPVVSPLFGLVLGAFTTIAIDYAFEARGRRRARAVFGQFVPAHVIRDLVDRGVGEGDDLLRAREWDVTVMFSDLRGFTAYSDGRPPAEIIAMLNRYLGAMTDQILANRGVVISYMGDGIMAVFGAPEPYTDHAQRALDAGLAMLSALERLNDELRAAGETPFRMGVGLNSGPVVAGNLGTVQRLEYTMIGDTTNTASRVEGLTKDAGHDLLLTQSVLDRIDDPPEDLVQLEATTLRGKSAPIALWSVHRAARNVGPTRQRQASG